MIALIIFVFGDLCIFFERFIPRFLWAFLFSVNFAFSTGDVQTLWQNRHDSIDFFLRWIWQLWTVPFQNCMWKICLKKTASEKAQYCRWKICRWEGVKNLQVKRCHPNTAGGSKAPSQNCRWSMQFGLGTPRMPMCGKLRYSFRRTLILSCAKTFLQQKPVLKDIFSPARLQHINVNMLRIFFSLRTRFYRRAGPVVFYSPQSCLPYGGPLCENLTLHNGNFKKDNPNLFYYLE